MNWTLPTRATLGGREYQHRSDFREMLKLIEVLSDESRPEQFRWLVAAEYFFTQSVPDERLADAYRYLSEFLCAGRPAVAGPKRICWKTDALAIADGVSRVAGQDVRGMAYLHWWSFLSLFHAIGPGELLDRVTIRQKLSRGQRLEDSELEYCRLHPEAISLSADSPEKQALLKRMDNFSGGQ